MTCQTCEGIGLVKVVSVNNRDTGRFQRCECDLGQFKPHTIQVLPKRRRQGTPPPIPKGARTTIGETVGVTFQLKSHERVLAEALARHHKTTVQEIAKQAVLQLANRGPR